MEPTRSPRTEAEQGGSRSVHVYFPDVADTVEIGDVAQEVSDDDDLYGRTSARYQSSVSQAGSVSHSPVWALPIPSPDGHERWLYGSSEGAGVPPGSSAPRTLPFSGTSSSEARSPQNKRGRYVTEDGDTSDFLDDDDDDDDDDSDVEEESDHDEVFDDDIVSDIPIPVQPYHTGGSGGPGYPRNVNLLPDFPSLAMVMAGQRLTRPHGHGAPSAALGAPPATVAPPAVAGPSAVVAPPGAVARPVAPVDPERAELRRRVNNMANLLRSDHITLYHQNTNLRLFETVEMFYDITKLIRYVMRSWCHRDCDRTIHKDLDLMALLFQQLNQRGGLQPDLRHSLKNASTVFIRFMMHILRQHPHEIVPASMDSYRDIIRAFKLLYAFARQFNLIHPSELAASGHLFRDLPT